MSKKSSTFAAKSSKGERNMSVQKHSLNQKQLLSKKLYDNGYLWSYKAIGNNAMLPDEELIFNGLSHLEFEDGLAYALKFTRHQVHSKAILSALITPTLYPKPMDFDLMQPKYNVSPEEMADYFMGVIAARKK